MKNAVSGKAMENVRNIETSNLTQQKGEEPIWCQNQIIKLHTNLCIENLLAKEMKKRRYYE